MADVPVVSEAQKRLRAEIERIRRERASAPSDPFAARAREARVRHPEGFVTGPEPESGTRSITGGARLTQQGRGEEAQAALDQRREEVRERREPFEPSVQGAFNRIFKPEFARGARETFIPPAMEAIERVDRFVDRPLGAGLNVIGGPLERTPEGRERLDVRDPIEQFRGLPGRVRQAAEVVTTPTERETAGEQGFDLDARIDRLNETLDIGEMQQILAEIGAGSAVPVPGVGAARSIARGAGIVLDSGRQLAPRVAEQVSQLADDAARRTFGDLPGFSPRGGGLTPDDVPPAERLRRLSEGNPTARTETTLFDARGNPISRETIQGGRRSIDAESRVVDETAAAVEPGPPSAQAPAAAAPSQSDIERANSLRRISEEIQEGFAASEKAGISEAYFNVGHDVDDQIEFVLRRGTTEGTVSVSADGVRLADEVTLEEAARLLDTAKGTTGRKQIRNQIEQAQVGEAAGGAPPSRRPPAPPSEPPSGGPPTAPTPSGDDLVERMTQIIKEAKPAREVREADVTRELGKRAAQGRKALEKGDTAGLFRSFKGELPKTGDIDPLSQSFTAADGETLRQMINRRFVDSPFEALSTHTALNKLFDVGDLPTRSELALLEKVFGPELVEAILSRRGKFDKGWEIIREVINIPRAMLATGEISSTLRQAPLLAHEDGGKVFRDAFKQQLKAFKNEANAKASAEAITQHEMFAASQRAGLDLTVTSDVRAATPAMREEPFIGARLLEKSINVKVGDRTINVNLLGEVLKASERAYVTMLNEMRFYSFVNEAEKLGPNATSRQLRDLAHEINILTGRGNLGKFNDASQVLNSVFFSPRFAVSRFQVPLSVMTTSPQKRKLAAKSLVAYTTTVMPWLVMADVSGVANVDWNPLSSDFLKARIGNTRIDPWAGLQQPVVLAARLATGKTRTLTTREIVDIDAGQALWRFATNKLHPTTRFIVNRGKGFGGEEPLAESPMPNVPKAVWDNLVFLFVQDTVEAWEEHGAAGGVAAGAGSALGIGFQTFGTDAERIAMDNNQSFNNLKGVRDFDDPIVLGIVPQTIDLVSGKGGVVELTDEQHAEYQQIMGNMVIESMPRILAKAKQLPEGEVRRDWVLDQIGRVKDAARERFENEVMKPAVRSGQSEMTMGAGRTFTINRGGGTGQRASGRSFTLKRPASTPSASKRRQEHPDFQFDFDDEGRPTGRVLEVAR